MLNGKARRCRNELQRRMRPRRGSIKEGSVAGALFLGYPDPGGAPPLLLQEQMREHLRVSHHVLDDRVLVRLMGYLVDLRPDDRAEAVAPEERRHRSAADALRLRLHAIHGLDRGRKRYDDRRVGRGRRRRVLALRGGGRDLHAELLLDLFDHPLDRVVSFYRKMDF